MPLAQPHRQFRHLFNLRNLCRRHPATDAVTRKRFLQSYLLVCQKAAQQRRPTN
jgi:hypothetical protein